jgi:hypothetical protein
MSTLITAQIARFDYRVRVAAILLRGAPRSEHILVAGMALASVAAGWPFGGALYPVVAIPALLALVAMIRHHLDGLDARRDALTAAGAKPADTLVIQVSGPLGATCVGAVVGLGASVGLGRFPVQALVPLAAGLVAAFLIRRTWLGAPALAVSSLAALATAVVARVATARSVPVAEARSRPIRELAAAHAPLLPNASHAPHAAASVWGAAWPTALAAVLALAATQVVITRRERLRELARTMTAAALRRLIPRSGA